MRLTNILMESIQICQKNRGFLKKIYLFHIIILNRLKILQYLYYFYGVALRNNFSNIDTLPKNNKYEFFS